MNNPTPIPGASSTANWRRRKEENLTKRRVCASALVLLFLAVGVGILPAPTPGPQESPPMGPEDLAESNYQLGAWFDPSGETSPGNLLKKVDQPTTEEQFLKYELVARHKGH
jgi:hypothetical protein